jgi:ribose transport system substrate-binding protein
VKAVLSTTGGGPITWANAQKEAGRQLIIIGMDYTRPNLDLVKSGEVYGIIAQPLWDEAYGAAELLARSLRGEKIDSWTKLPAPLVTKENLARYYALLDKVEAGLKKTP